MAIKANFFQGRRSIWMDGLFSATAFLAVYFLWNSSALSWLIYPLRLLVTFIHETGHALVAILTGGVLHEFVVNADGSGFVRISGGNALLIAPAGYLGTAIFGAWLFMMNHRVRSPRILAFVLGLATIVFSLLLLYFDQLAPDAWEGSNSQLAILIGTATGGILMLLGWLTRPIIVRWLLLVLSVSCSLEALMDITIITGMQPVVFVSKTDIHQFAELVPIFNVTVWAYIWVGIAILIFMMAIRYSYHLRFTIPTQK